MGRSLTIPHELSQEEALRCLQLSTAFSDKFGKYDCRGRRENGIGKFTLSVADGKIRSVNITIVVLPSKVGVSLEFQPVTAVLD